MIPYLDRESIVEEFTYIGKRGNNIEFSVHSVNYLSFPLLGQSERDYLLERCVFADEAMFDSRIYGQDVSMVFLSTLSEPNLGVYRNRLNGLSIAFGEAAFPLTERDNWDGYVNGTLFTADNVFTREYLESFSREWSFEGALTPDQIGENIARLLEITSPKARICLLLGSETPYLANVKRNYENRHLVHREINERLREMAQREERLILLDFNDFIHGQEDFTDNINHFQRRVYYEAAMKANELISAVCGRALPHRGRLYLGWRLLADRVEKTGFFQSRLYSKIRKPVSRLSGRK